jgi:signal transduction histidine kinase
MTLSKIAERIKPLQIILGSLVLLVINLLVNHFSADDKTMRVFNSVCGLAFSFLLSTILLLLYSVSRKNHFIFSHTLMWMALSMAGWTIGDATYLYFILIDIDPFISFSDIFYIIASVLMIVSVLTLPGSQPPSRRRNMVFIEISILILSAIVIFIILMLAPGNPNLNFSPLTMMMIFIYPVFDIVMIWIIMILFFLYPRKSSQKVLGAIFLAAISIFLSDLVYLVNNLYIELIDGYIVDLGYYLFYTLFVIGGLIGFKEIRQPEPKVERETTAFNSGNWIVYLPGVFLIVVIGLLIIFVLNNSFVLFHGIIVLLVLIIVLFIIHQYLVIAANIKLTKEMKLINAQLENKVELRTAELSKANEELQEEMKERQKAEEHLSRSNTELEIVNKDKDRLFTIMAHDLRSPLGSMMKLSELLVENIKDFDEDEIHEVVDTLHKSATQTFQLLNDLLAWSALQMGRGERGKERFLISEIVKENIFLHNPAAARKQIEIQTEVNSGLSVFADKFAIQTVMRNLLSNAIKFTMPGGKVMLKAQEQGDLVMISVTDTGIGIAKNKYDTLFRIDSVNSSNGTEGEKGTGFGLLLCKDLIERNGGIIWFESEKDRGSTFNFTIPVYETENAMISNLQYAALGGKIEIKYDHSHRLGFTTFTGEFSGELLKIELMRIWNMPDYKPEYAILIDLRLATFVDENKNFEQVLEVFQAIPGKDGLRKFALLTTTPQQVVYSTMFSQRIRSMYPFSIEVFSTYDGALNWLGR